MRVASAILSQKKLEITPNSCIILLLRPAGDLTSTKLKGADFQRFGVLRQSYEILSSFSKSQACIMMTSFSTMLGSWILLALKIQLSTGFRQAPVKFQKSCSLMLFTNFITQRLQPQVLTQYRNLECSLFTFFSSQMNSSSILSLMWWKSGQQTLGLWAIRPCTLDHRTLEQFSWNCAHQSLLQYPFQQMTAGWRQLPSEHTAKMGWPQMQQVF